MNIRITLTVLDEVDLRGKEVLTIQPPATKFFWDHGNVTYLCGRCKTILAEDVHKDIPGNKVLKCNVCNSYNNLKLSKIP